MVHRHPVETGGISGHLVAYPRRFRESIPFGQSQGYSWNFRRRILRPSIPPLRPSSLAHEFPGSPRRWQSPCLRRTTSSPGHQTLTGADLLKTDILGVFAHPDDETGRGPWPPMPWAGAPSSPTCTAPAARAAVTWWHPVGCCARVLREVEPANVSPPGIHRCFFSGKAISPIPKVSPSPSEEMGTRGNTGTWFDCPRTPPEIIPTMNPAPKSGSAWVNHQAAGISPSKPSMPPRIPSRFPDQLRREGLSVWRLKIVPRGPAGTGATIDLSSP